MLLSHVAKNFREYVEPLNEVSTLSGMLLITEIGNSEKDRERQRKNISS